MARIIGSGLQKLGGLGSSGALPYATKVANIADKVVYYKMIETSGTTVVDSGGSSRNGTYNGITLDNTPGAGATMGNAPLWDAANDDVLVPASARTAMTGSVGTISFWAKVSSAAIWTSLATRRGFLFYKSGTFADTFGFRQNSGANHSVVFDLILGTTSKSITYTFPSTGPTAWFHVLMTWSKPTTDRFRAFINGAQVGTTQTTLGTFAASLDTSFIGSFDGAAQGWDGWLQHFLVYNHEATDAEILSLSTAS